MIGKCVGARAIRVQQFNELVDEDEFILDHVRKKFEWSNILNRHANKSE